MISLWKGCSSQHFDSSNVLTEGLKATVNMKNEEHMKIAISARINKLKTEENRAKTRIHLTQRSNEMLSKII